MHPGTCLTEAEVMTPRFALRMLTPRTLLQSKRKRDCLLHSMVPSATPAGLLGDLF